MSGIFLIFYWPLLNCKEEKIKLDETLEVIVCKMGSDPSSIFFQLLTNPKGALDFHLKTIDSRGSRENKKRFNLNFNVDKRPPPLTFFPNKFNRKEMAAIF